MSYVSFRDPKNGKIWRTDKDLNLICESVSVGSPEVRIYQESVPGMDGVLDMTEHFGRITYDPRELTIRAGKTITDRYKQDSLVKNALHGREMLITISDDPGHYYVGRIEVGEWVKQAGIGHVSIRAMCSPYKLRQQPTSVTASVPESGTKELILYNEWMPTVPTITASAAVKITWRSRTYAIEANKPYRNLDIELEPGANVLQVAAAAGTTITAEYQEGSL